MWLKKVVIFVSLIVLINKVSSNEESLIQLIQSYGYPIEEHNVTTADGYFLKLHRIPYGIKSGIIEEKPVVFLQHGLLCSSAVWITSGQQKSLAFILADAGYDVWMGNARGNNFSRSHFNLSSDSAEFWDFSWDEIGKYDLPAMIDFTLHQTNTDKLHYIGHSEGTTAFFVMCSLLPEYNRKIRSMHALSPGAFMSNLKSPLINGLSHYIYRTDFIKINLGDGQLLISDVVMALADYEACKDSYIFKELCNNLLFLISGYDSVYINETMLPDILTYTPAGASVKQLVHYAQAFRKENFAQYYYSSFGNIIKYGRFNPKEYNLTMITVPISLHYSENDLLADVKDVEKLAGKLPNLIGKYRVLDSKFNNLDFLWASNADTLVYDKIVTLMNEY